MVEIASPWPAEPRTVAAYLAVLETARERGLTITRTKMAKLLYLADLRCVEDDEDPVSGVEWRFLDHGPFNNDLMYLENALVASGVIVRDPYYGGWALRLAGDYRSAFQLPDEDREQLAATVADLGQYAAGTLKDLSYQTRPMVDAKKRGRGVVINLALARHVPDLTKVAARMNAVLRGLPAQDDDAGVADDLLEEHEEFADLRRRANWLLLGDDG